MTAAQRDAITTPSQGLIIFCSDCASGEGELQIKLTSSWKNITGGDVNDPQLAIGDFYQGGVVFHLFVEGETGYVAGETHGLIAAVQDQSSGIRWYNGSYGETFAIQTAIGKGFENTAVIIAAQGEIRTSYAAGLARAYTTGGGAVDWFLPSKDELNKMYTNRATINTTAAANGGSDFSANYYWSSTERDLASAWRQYFGNGFQGTFNKDGTYMVRAVWAF